MTKPIEIKSVVYNGDRYMCTIKHQLLANGKPGVSWLHEARDSSGRLVDSSTKQALERLLGLI